MHCSDCIICIIVQHTGFSHSWLHTSISGQSLLIKSIDFMINLLASIMQWSLLVCINRINIGLAVYYQELDHFKVALPAAR